MAAEMTKDGFAEYLRKCGYSAENDHGCVVVYVPEITKKVQKDVRQIAKECGYDRSYGWSTKGGETCPTS